MNLGLIFGSIFISLGTLSWIIAAAVAVLS
jgi:hypothetical protein